MIYHPINWQEITGIYHIYKINIYFINLIRVLIVNILDKYWDNNDFLSLLILYFFSINHNNILIIMENIIIDIQ